MRVVLFEPSVVTEGLSYKTAPTEIGQIFLKNPDDFIVDNGDMLCE